MTAESDVLAALDLDHAQFEREGRPSLFGDAATEIRRLRTELAAAKADTLRDLLGHDGDEVLIEVVAEAVRDAQVDGRVEYKRRVGLAGRRTIAETVLWRLREHLSENPTPPGSTGGA